MKRWIWVILFVGLAAFLVGCGAASPTTVTETSQVQRIDPEEAKPLLDSGEAVLYDTRSTESYRLQHAAGAISFPEADAEAHSDELPDEGERALIFYCT